MSSLTVGRVFGRKHLPKTIFIILLVSLFIWLGFWQLDRRQWRLGLNAELAAQLAKPPALINNVTDFTTLLTMTDRKVTASGSFDYSEQVVLKNRNSELNGPGVHLIAPYRLTNSEQAILVDRGWISTADWTNGDYEQYDESFDQINGIVQQYDKPARNATAVTTEQSELFRLTFEQLQSQIEYELLPIIIQQTDVTPNLNARPYREPQAVELSEGNHLSYAVQWFSFAIIFGGGYLYYLRRES